MAEDFLLKQNAKAPLKAICRIKADEWWVTSLRSCRCAACHLVLSVTLPRGLTSPLPSHPQDTPSILDWPLPQPAYDEVTTEIEDQSEDQEVRSINKGFTEDTAATPSTGMAGRSESQSADLFQELQREVENVRYVVSVSRSMLFHADPSDPSFCLCG